MTLNKPLIFAHRGASDVKPENTMDAFELALRQGADGFELDVQLSKDGEIIVAHDVSLERVSDGEGYVYDYTFAELQQFDFGKVKSNAGVCKIPLLRDVYELVNKTDIQINVELKTTDYDYPELPQKLITLANEYRMGERIIYSSFNHYSVMKIRSLRSMARIGLLYTYPLYEPWRYAGDLSANAIHPHYQNILSYPDVLHGCIENGIDVNVWTVDDVNAIKTLAQMGVTTIITNKPDVAISAIE